MRLLIIGKLGGHIGTASRIAKARGAEIKQVDDLPDAVAKLRAGQGADMLMVDVNEDIKELKEALTRERIFVPIVACGLGSAAQPAADAIRAGAKEYLPLPPDAELIAAVLQSVARHGEKLIFQDPAMHKIVRMAEQVAPSDASVLITGESGTGKEVMARFIHDKSRRGGRQFISVNCAAIPENLLESELFGHEKGAFTGAIARRIGKFEEASGGTLLLDEISEMHPLLQAKLLRALQERVIDRVGGRQSIPVDIRVIATSNRNLVHEVERGNFREDLYFRLNVVPIALPPLRERPMDIALIAQHYLEKYAKENGLDTPVLTRVAQHALRTHLWKGNIRELENIIHRAVLLCDGREITPETLALCGIQSTSSLSEASEASAELPPSPSHANYLVGQKIAEVERDLIIGTLSHCLGNRTQAANILGISIRTLRNKLNQYKNEDHLKEELKERAS